MDDPRAAADQPRVEIALYRSDDRPLPTTRTLLETLFAQIIAGLEMERFGDPWYVFQGGRIQAGQFIAESHITYDQMPQYRELFIWSCKPFPRTRPQIILADVMQGAWALIHDISEGMD